MGLVDKAEDAARRAAGVARKGAEGARDKAQELGLKRRSNALAEELGHVVVRQHDGEPGLEPEVERLVAEIRAVRAEIAGLDED
jgi:hypothetical protein